MGGEQSPVEVCNSGPLVVPSWLIYMLDNRCPYKALRWFVWSTGLTAHPQDCADCGADRPLITAHDDDGRCAVPRDKGARGVCNKAQILIGQEFFDELSAELTLHECIASDLADPASA